jgi:hypothetical protein
MADSQKTPSSTASKGPKPSGTAAKAATTALAAEQPEVAVALGVAEQAKKKTAKAATSGKIPIRQLKTQWIVGILVMWLLPFVKPDFFKGFNAWISRQLAWTAVYVVLLLVAGAGPRAARTVAMFGWLPLLMLVLAPWGPSELGTVVSGAVSDDMSKHVQPAPTDTTTPAYSGSAWLASMLGTQPQQEPQQPAAQPPTETV